MQAFYSPAGPDTFAPSPSTAGPWDAASQHGGPPAALLTRAVEQLPEAAGRVVGRLTVELLGPVPVAPLRVSAAVVRPGRTVAMAEATAYDVARERACARVTAWLFPATDDGPDQDPEPPAHGPDDGAERGRPPGWTGGYLDAVEWRWVRGSTAEAGPGVVWMRPRVRLLDGEPTSPVQRLMTCADSASGVSAVLDPARWRFLNTELTVHVLRPPLGEWVCLEASTTLGPGSVGIATSAAYDVHGLVARTAQALLVAPVAGTVERGQGPEQGLPPARWTRYS